MVECGVTCRAGNARPFGDVVVVLIYNGLEDGEPVCARGGVGEWFELVEYVVGVVFG